LLLRRLRRLLSWSWTLNDSRRTNRRFALTGFDSLDSSRRGGDLQHPLRFGLGVLFGASYGGRE